MTWHVPDDVIVSRDGGIAWVLPTRFARIVRLDEVSSLIWEGADGAQDTEALVARLADDHGWEPQEIRAHVEGFVDELTACGLLEKETS